AGASSSKSYDYSKNPKSTPYHDGTSRNLKICDDFTRKEKSKPFDYSRNLKSTSYHEANFSGNSKMYDDLTKKADIDVRSQVKGNSAFLLFDNEAVGKNSHVQGAFSQETVAGHGSPQSGLFVSAANGRTFAPTAK